MATMPDFSLPNLSSELPNLSSDVPDKQSELIASPPIQDEIKSEPVVAKANQLPTWMVVAVIALMVVVPVALLLLSGGNASKQTGETSSPDPSPTRTELAAPTHQPTPKTTPSVELSPSLLAATPSPAITPTSTATPTPASQSNLTVDEVYFEDPQTGQKLDGQLYAGQPVSLRAKARNTGTAAANNFISYWKYQGNLVGRNSNGSLKAGSSAVYDDINSLVYSGIVLKEGDATIAYFLDPDNALGEANIVDNSKSSTVKVNATRTDLEVTGIEFYHPQTSEKITTPTVGQQVLIRPVVKNLGQDKQINYDIEWWLNDSKVKQSTIKQWLPAGESLVVSESHPHTFAADSTKIKVIINPDKTIPETNSGNNERMIDVSL